MAENKRRKRKKKAKKTFGKIIPVLVAIVLIILIVILAYGKNIFEKYSYAGDVEELADYFGVFDDTQVAIIYNNEHIENRGFFANNNAYLPLDMIKENFTNHFYVGEGVLYYTTATDIISVTIDDEYANYCFNDEIREFSCDPVIASGEVTYIAVDFLKLFTDFEYTLYSDDIPYYMTITDSGSEPLREAAVKKNTKLRHRGGVKSEILETLEEGRTVYIIEELDDWAKVITTDTGLIGYIEIKRYNYTGNEYVYNPTEITYPLEYESLSVDSKINMAFHQVFGKSGIDNLESDIQASNTVNVIAPTWFRIVNEMGSIEDISSAEYVELAHDNGMMVWAVWTDVDYDVDTTELFTTKELRDNLINQMIDKSIEKNIDGINIDFEKIKGEAGEGFVEFLRELSIKTHENGIYLSVDNYSPTASTKYYNRKEQGRVCDYVVIMGYDEHWAGCSEPGSVASLPYVDNGINATINEGVAADKIINAIPFYTRLWKTSGGVVSSETIGMDVASQWLAKNNVTSEWNSECCQNYAESEIEGVLYQIWLEDGESLEFKLEAMENAGVAGVAEWKLGLENDEVWKVIDEYVSR